MLKSLGKKRSWLHLLPKTWKWNKRNATKTKPKPVEGMPLLRSLPWPHSPRGVAPSVFWVQSLCLAFWGTHRAVQHVFSVLCLPLQRKLLNHGLSTIHIPLLLTLARGPFACQSGHRFITLALLLTVWQAKASQIGGWAGTTSQGDVHILLEMVCKDGFLTRSPERVKDS